MQRSLIVEEFKEFLDAENQLIMGLTVNATDCLKELADLVYVCYQYAENLGWDLDEALNRVHVSNMSKLGPDGKPIRREDGKVLKGPNYQPPVLACLSPVPSLSWKTLWKEKMALKPVGVSSAMRSDMVQELLSTLANCDHEELRMAKDS